MKFLVEQRQTAKTRHKSNSATVNVIPEYDRCAACYRLFILRKRAERGRTYKYPNDIETAEREAREAHQYDDPNRVIWNEKRDECLCSECELERFLKVDANAIYGVFAEMNHNLMSQDATDKSKPKSVFGLAGQSWQVKNPEQSGEFCFPPFAAIITGGARLMLAMLESEVKYCGSALLFCDTDSGCIPATATGEHDGPIPVLSYARVNAIREKFNALNPYDRSIVPELVKWEYPEDNEPVYVTAISAKRYALYHLRNGNPHIIGFSDEADTENTGEPTDQDNTRIDVVKRSEHGLGLYMNPLVQNANDEKDAHDPNWYEQAWEYMIRKHVLGQDVPEPTWFNLPAMSRFPIRTLHTWKSLDAFNADLRPDKQIRPFNFYLAAHPVAIERIRELKLRLITPFSDDPSTWLDATYVDLHTKRKYRITTDIDAAIPGKVIAVKTYRSIIHSYVNHPEFKYDDADGKQCQSSTRGRLYPAHVYAESFTHISKDSSSISRASEEFEYGGPKVYHNDSRQRLEMIVRSLLSDREYGRKRETAQIRFPAGEIGSRNTRRIL